MDEEKDIEINNSVPEEGPKIMSKINFADNIRLKPGFEIVVGEIKSLPVDYKKSPAIVACLKKGDLVLMDKPSKEKKDADVTLDMKDVANFLNQNTQTVLKQLKINDLSIKDLQKLLVAERKNKQRKKIIDFIKTLKEVA